MNISTPKITSPDNMPRAMTWMIVSCISFALMGATVKLSGDVPLTTKVFFRNLVTMGITTVVAIRLRQNPFGPTTNFTPLMVRSLSGLSGVFLFFFAINWLDLADAALLNKTAPFFVTLFAVALLKEKLDRAVIPALFIAFAGAILVIKPEFNMTVLPALAGAGSGLFTGISHTLVRALKGKESPNRIIFYFSMVSSLATAPFLFFSQTEISSGQWLALIGTGVFAAGGQYGMTLAYHHAQASRISVFTYLHVLFSGIVGFLIWNEQSDLASLAGGLLIVGSAIYIHRRGVSFRNGD